MPAAGLQALASLGDSLTEALLVVEDGDRIVYVNDCAAALLGGSAALGRHSLAAALRRLAELDAAPAIAADRLLDLCRRADPAETVQLTAPDKAPLTVRALPLVFEGAGVSLAAVTVTGGEKTGARPLAGLVSGAALAGALGTSLDALDGAVDALAHSWQARDGALVAEEIGQLRQDSASLRRAAVALHAVMGLFAGASSPATTAVDVSDLLMAIMPQWKPRAPRHSFELALAGEAPQVSAVEPLVTLALDCLLEIATTWTPQGGVIRVTVRSSDNGVSVSVRPYTAGRYLGPRQGDHVPAPTPIDLQASDTLARTSLGLAVVRAIVEAHGGKLAIEHTAAGGTVTLVAKWPCAGPGCEPESERPAPAPNGIRDALGPVPRAGRQTVLVWEPDARTLRYLRANLEPQGFRCVHAESFADVAHLVELEEPDAVLLEVDEVAEQAKSMVEELRSLTGVPLVLLTRRYDSDQCATLLNAGATDYIGKPFNIDELMARLRVGLRANLSVAGDRHAERVVKTGDLCIDLAQRVVSVGGSEVHLSKTEFKLLRVLAQHLGTVLAHDMLLERVWGAGYAQESDFVWVYVRRLRRKIEPDPAHPQYVITVPGVGYRLARLPVPVPEEAAPR